MMYFIDFMVSDRIVFGINIFQYGCESLSWENNDNVFKIFHIVSTVGFKPTTTRLKYGRPSDQDKQFFDTAILT